MAESAGRRWVYVTGMPRSGTTFAATVLTAARGVMMLHEPFNPQCGVLGVDWERAKHLGEGLAPPEDAREAIGRMLRLRVRQGSHVPPSDPLVRRMVKRLAGSRGPYHLRRSKLRPWCQAGVVKDPTGWSLSAHLSDEHGLPVVVTVKHPLAQVAGYQRAGWTAKVKFFDPGSPLLGLLDEEDRRLMEQYGGGDADPLEAAAVSWRLTYRVLLGWARERSAWRVAVMEQLSADPGERFSVLAGEVGLPWDRWSDRAIQRMTGGHNPAEARPGRFQDLKRDSRRVFELRRASLSAAERARVFELTWPVANEIYDEESFGLSDGEKES
ncbi:MAG: hypothetical protein AAGI68_03765 [Planctomycetota bacterium]